MSDARSSMRRAVDKGRLALREIVELGPRTMAAVAVGTVQSGIEARRADRITGAAATTRSVGIMTAAEGLTGPEGPVGLRCWFTEGDLEVRFVADDAAVLTWGPSAAPVPWGRSPDGGPPGPTAPVELVTGPVDRGARAYAAGLSVTVGPDGAVRFHNAAGRLVRHELAPLRRGPTRTVRSRLRRGERVAGLGEQASPVDLSGTTHRLWNRDPGGAWGPGQDPLYCGIPVLVGLHPDGDVLVFHQNPADATVRIDAARPPLGGSSGLRVTFAGGPLRHVVVAGPLPRLLERLTEVTGRPPLPPRWALGYHQCRWGYKSAGDIREVAEGFAAEGLPLSAVHLDIDYMDRYRVFSVDHERFPDLAGLSAELGRRGTRVVTILDPGVATDPDHQVYAEGLAGGHFVTRSDGTVATGVVWPGRVAFPDFTDPATRAWWAGHYRALLDQGVAGIWHDMNEPTSISLWGDHTIPRLAPMHGEGDGTDHRLGHNVYGLLMNEAGFEGLREARPDRRPFILSRSGWAGLQRTAWNWTGDVESTWEGLGQQVATAIGLGLSGVPFTGSDIGGFSGTPSPELYLRWLELSVLMPFCRTHSVLGAPPREPWRFEAPVRQAIGRLIRLRYRLLPYLYTLAWQASRTGHPLVRPLWWPSPDAPDVDGDHRPWCDDAYLLGEALLVAPVSEPGAVARSLPLPGGRWLRWRLAPAMAGSGRRERRRVDRGRAHGDGRHPGRSAGGLRPGGQHRAAG